MAEIYACFKFLVENTPTWIGDVEELERRVGERRVEIEKIPTRTSRNNKRTASNESLRENGRTMSGPSCYATANRLEANSNPETAHSSNGYVNSYSHGAQSSPSPQRKRKTPSVLSNNTAPVKFRSRSMVIVYYDSRVQATFEQLVRNIGAGRNHIRKARMAARMEALRADSEDTDDERFERPAFRSTRHHGLLSMNNTNTGKNTDDNRVAADAALNEVDAALERAQGFCERGAHQFLRDGACSEETASTKDSFRTLLGVAERELARQNVRLQERREEEHREEEHREEEHREEEHREEEHREEEHREEEHREEEHREEEYQEEEHREEEHREEERRLAGVALAATAAAVAAQVEMMMPTTVALAGGPIEADDDDNDDSYDTLNIKLPSFRPTARA